MNQALWPHRSLAAPAENGGLLAFPPFDLWPDLVARNSQTLHGSTMRLGDKSLADLARQARRHLLDTAWRYSSGYRSVSRPEPAAPIVLAGHQPQLFHPGVWAKNLALAALARQLGGTAVNLVIDSDVCRTASIQVPAGPVEQPWQETVPIDSPADAVAYELRQVVDHSLLASFDRRVTDVLAPLVPDPIVRQFWPLVVQRAAATGNLGAALAQARHQWEARWNVDTLEVPQSVVCASAPFHWFAAFLLADLPRLLGIHNQALDEYRRAYRLRSANHPAPRLAQADDLYEAPFWVYRSDAPRRHRVFAARCPSGVRLTDRNGWQAELPLGREGDFTAAVETLDRLRRAGVRLRTRALFTTLWARLALGDLFIHGLGGGKYDELTDRIIDRWLGHPPPAYGVFTGTLRLPIAGVGNEPADRVADIDRQLWSLAHQPERFIDWDSLPASQRQEAAERVEAKRRWIAESPPRGTGRSRCQALADLTRQLLPLVESQRMALHNRRAAAVLRNRAAAVLWGREYAFCLFPEQDLRKFLLAIPGRPR